MPILSLGIYDTLQGTKIACLSPWVKVVNDCFAIDGHVEYTNTFIVIFLTTAFTLPRLYKVELHTVVTIGNGQVIPQTMTPKAEELEQLVALGATNVFLDMAL